MKQQTQMKDIAPCGMNCSLCLAFQREKNHCPGCNQPDKDKHRSCQICSIKTCDEHKGRKTRFCYECDRFPCPRLKQIDKRYRTKYHMSMIDNLESIKKRGLKHFVDNENDRWHCPCGSLVCVHRDKCQNCGRLSDFNT